MLRSFLVITFFAGILLFSPVTSQAQSLQGQITGQLSAGAEKAGYSTTSQTDPRSIIAGVIKTFLSIVGTIFVVLMLMSGYSLLTAHGEEDKIEQGQKTLRRAIIGIVIVMMSYSITAFITRGAERAVEAGPEVRDRSNDTSTTFENGRLNVPWWRRIFR